jgi:hypothetical protein
MKHTVLSARTLLMSLLILLSCDNQEPSVTVDRNAVFNSFSTNGQTLSSVIRRGENLVRLEVNQDVDVTRLIPEFETPSGYSVFANGVKQISGNSEVDFSQPVDYELRDGNNRSTSWQVSVVPLGCKILIDASHDGGVWWFPQYEATGFNANQYHQGQSFANLLRDKGFEVTELGRGVELTEEMFFGHYIVIRAGGFQTYTARELEVYANLLDRGMNMVFFTDHKKNDPVDELGNHLGLDFKGVAFGAITTLVSHEITANIDSIDYIAGSVLMNASQNPDVEILGWLGKGHFADLNFNEVKDGDEPTSPPVMGILNYPKSRIFFLGDMNGIEIQPQPFIDNLIQWMGHCF